MVRACGSVCSSVPAYRIPHKVSADLGQGYRIWPMTDLAKASDHPERLRFRLMGRFGRAVRRRLRGRRSEEHTPEVQSLMRTSYAVFCLTKKRANKEPVDPIAIQNKCNDVLLT